MTLNGAIMELVVLHEHPMMPDFFKPGIQHIIETLSEVEEPERRTGGWIPCSERLPERYGWYLCTLKDGRVNCYYWNNKGEWMDNGKKHFFDLYNIRSRYTGEEINPEQEGSVYWTDWVIAWMPLPEPYKEEGDNEQRD